MQYTGESIVKENPPCAPEAEPRRGPGRRGALPRGPPRPAGDPLG